MGSVSSGDHLSKKGRTVAYLGDKLALHVTLCSLTRQLSLQHSMKFNLLNVPFYG